MRLVLVTSIFIFFFLQARSQHAAADSLLDVYHAYHKTDAKKLSLLQAVTFAYAFTNAAKATLYADSTLLLANKLKDLNGIAGSYMIRGNINIIQAKRQLALVDFQQGLKVLSEAKQKDDGLKTQLLISLGQTYKDLGKFDMALESYKSSLDISYHRKDTLLIANANAAIGIIYMAVEDWQSARDYINTNSRLLQQKDGYLLNSRKEYKYLYLLTLSNLGSLMNAQKNYAEATQVLERAGDSAAKWQLSFQLADVNRMIASTYYRTGDFKKAYNAALSAYSTHLKTNNKGAITSDLTNLGRILRDAPDDFLKSINIEPAQRNDTAMAVLSQAVKISENLKSLVLREGPAEEMSLMYEKAGNYPKAYQYYKTFKTIHDSLTNNNQQKSILVTDMQYRFGRQTDSLKFTQAIQQTNLIQQVFVNKQQAQIAIKEKQLQHLVFLKTQSELQNTSLENSRNLKQLYLTNKENELKEVIVSQLGKDKDIAALKLRQQKAFSIIAIGVLLLLGAVFFYNSHLRRKKMQAGIERDKAEQKLLEAELKNKMNDITLSALRSQMNPHFIFNCLNSIQLYTLENKTEAASEYIGKFSKLIRSMLDNSRTDRVTLASELESIKLYIELEAMRFKNKLKYKINVDRNVDADFTELPPLLVQPYVENAIWHGLMNKKEGGTIIINVNQDHKKNILLIEIRDDGVGRKNAEAFKLTKLTGHTSLGTKVTGERIAIINEKYKSSSRVIIHDLYENGIASGTQVLIELPLE